MPRKACFGTLQHMAGHGLGQRLVGQEHRAVALLRKPPRFIAAVAAHHGFDMGVQCARGGDDLPHIQGVRRSNDQHGGAGDVRLYEHGRVHRITKHCCNAGLPQ